MTWLEGKAIKKRALVALGVALLALTFSPSGVAQGPCLIERGLDPLDVVNTGVRHNVWILLDTSGSMNVSFAGGGDTKLVVAKRVLLRIIDEFVDAAGRPLFNWGFVNFDANNSSNNVVACSIFSPDPKLDGGCAGLDLSKLITPPACGGADNRQTIRDRITSLSARRTTPNGISLDQLSKKMVADNFVANLLPDQKNFVIHVTDGDDTCECGDKVWTPTPVPPFLASNPITAQLRGGVASPAFTRGANNFSDRQAANAGTKARLAYERLNPTDADRAAGLKGDVFVIGMGLDGDSPSRAHHLAWEGSGAGYNRVGRPAFLANNETELVRALRDALGEIGLPPSTITLGSPVVGTVKELVPASDPRVLISEIESRTDVRAANRNNVLLNATVELPGFKGHLTARKVFNVVQELDPQGNPVDVKRPDFSLLWDAGVELQNRDPDGRTIFFNRRNETILRPFRVGVVTAADLGVGVGYLSDIDGIGARTVDDAVRMVVNVIRGYRLSVDPATGTLYKADNTINFSTTDENGDPTWKLFDATHGGPTLVLNPPRAPGDDPPLHDVVEYTQFFRDRFNRQSVVYLPTNGGMMHAFRADNGAELYAYIPDDVVGLGPGEIPGSRSTLKDLVTVLVGKRNGVTNHVFLLTSSVSVEDVFLNSDNKWHTVIVLGRGRGGKFFTGLDVSDIGNWDRNPGNKAPIPEAGPSVPRLLFNVGNRDGVNDGDYDGLGETWSQAALGEVLENNRPQSVLIAGSGYGCKNTDEGRFLYVLRLENGSVLRRFGPIPSNLAAPVANALVAPPAAFNPHAFDPQKIDPRDRITRTFIGDLQGGVWKLDSSAPNPGAWVFGKFMDLGLDQPITAGIGLLADRFNQNQLFVFVGTGGDQRVNNPQGGRFKMAGLVDSARDGAVKPGAFIQIAAGGDFFLDLPPDERVFVSPATAPTDNGTGAVFIASSRADFVIATCRVRFFSTLFGFQATTGLGAFDIDPQSGEGASQVDLGETKVTGLYHRDSHLYVSRSGGIGVDAATEVLGEDTFPSQFFTSGIQVLVDSFRLSPF